MQFTGLTDKNGREIYEGDFLFLNEPDFKDGNGTVFRGLQEYAEVQWRDGKLSGIDSYSEDLTVVGFVARRIPGRFVRKPQMYVVPPEAIYPGRELTDPIEQTESFCSLGDYKQNIEVIGNKFENPALLETA